MIFPGGGVEPAARGFHAATVREPSSEPVFFDAVLRPNPPLGPRTLLAILTAVAAANFAFGINFVLHGAWPIAPFMGADVVLLAWAFHASRQATRVCEHVTLTPSELLIARWPVRGRPATIALNPYWLRIEFEGNGEPVRRLFVSSHGRSVPLGAFLAPEDRASLAEALKAALRAAKEYRPA